MFFDSASDIQKIAKNHSTSIFILPSTEKVTIKNAIVLEPQEKTVITIEQIRSVLERLKLKQQKSQYIIIRPADKMQPETANAILKNLEEPGENIHFILITENLTKILPTIRSRSAIYFLKNTEPLSMQITADEKTKTLAKKLLTIKNQGLISFANEVTKNKDREYVLNILSTAIEMSYKAYFLNHKDVFLKKIPKLLTAYDNIAKNGHIKLHLVADLC